MIDMGAIRAAFPELSNLEPLSVPDSGQKYVFRADAASGMVALKLIKSVDDARTLREIEAVSRLCSPYVPGVEDHGKRLLGGVERIFLVEQFIQGRSYRECLSSERQPLHRVLRLAEALLRVCVDCEKEQIVHRDIKPENIMIGEGDGKVWVIDFGLARLLDMESLTTTDRNFGPCTLGYGAPEQLRNLKREVDSRADLFSVGVVLYEALNGANPYLALLPETFPSDAFRARGPKWPQNHWKSEQRHGWKSSSRNASLCI